MIEHLRSCFICLFLLNLIRKIFLFLLGVVSENFKEFLCSSENDQSLAFAKDIVTQANHARAKIASRVETRGADGSEVLRRLAGSNFLARASGSLALLFLRKIRHRSWFMCSFKFFSCLFIYSTANFRFASAKKCSNEGRALMQLDFQQYLMKLEKLTDIR